MSDLDFSIETERDTLTGFLDLQRAAMVRKLGGVSDSDARATPTASSLSLLSLVKHSALWERRWFQVVVAGRKLPPIRPAAAAGEGDHVSFHPRRGTVASPAAG